MEASEKAKELRDRMYVAGGSITMVEAKSCALEAAKLVFKEYAKDYAEDEIFWSNVIEELKKL
jgi:hypothetical protein